MKTHEKKVIFMVIICNFLLMGNLFAQNSVTVHLDTVNTNDTIFICSGLDALEFYGPSGATGIKWMTNHFNDTTIAQNISLPGDFQGYISCQFENPTYQSIDFFVVPFEVDAGEDKYIACGNTTPLEVWSNYNKQEDLTFSWIPETGLDDASIINPTATISDTIKYYATVSIEGLCSQTDSVSVILKPHSQPEICRVGVDTTNKNIIVWEQPVSPFIESYNVYKESVVTDIYDVMDTVYAIAANYLIDSHSSPDVQSNKYKLSFTDACGVESKISSAHKTLHLAINRGQGDDWNLIWEPYEGATVSTYYIYRGTDKDTLELIGTTSGSSTQYSDLTAPKGQVFYQIEIVIPRECTLMKSANYSFSRSNIAWNGQTGVNENQFDEIKVYPNPVSKYLYIENGMSELYNLKLFNLSGQVVYEKKNASGKNTITLTHLQRGFYIVEITSEGKFSTRKILIK